MLSIPFYQLGAAGGRLPGLAILPTSALMAFVPMTSALILVYWQRGIGGAVALFKSAFDTRGAHGAGWYLTALLFMPTVCALEFGVLRLAGSALPVPQIALDEALFFFLIFFVGAIGEEFGWQGFAYAGLRTRRNALGAALILGVVWALWHVIPFVQLGRSANWIVWHSLSAVALRIVIVWLYENTSKSVFIAVVFHTMINVSWALFPIAGSFYDPFVTFVILVLAVGSILLVWRPSTLARFRDRARGAPSVGVEQGPRDG